MPIVSTYPYDPGGNSPSNLIANEIHTVSTPTQAVYAHYFIPRYAPFFDSSFKASRIVNGSPVPLIEGTDYHLAFPVSEAQEVLGVRLHGAVMLIDRGLEGDISIEYQTIGGAFAENDTNGLLGVYRLLYEITYYSWDMVTGQPAGYVPDYHLHDESDQTMQDVTNLLTAILVRIGANNVATGVEFILPGQVAQLTINFPTAAAVAAYFGFGTWQQVSRGRYPVGAGNSVDADGKTLVVNGGQLFGVKEVVQTSEQVGNHVHPVTLEGPGGDPSRNFSSWRTDNTANYAMRSDPGTLSDNLLAYPNVDKGGNHVVFNPFSTANGFSDTQPMTNLPPSEGFYYWLRVS